MKVCLDTNAYSVLCRGCDGLQALLEEADEVVVPATVLGELVYGFLKGSRPRENMAALDAFFASGNVRLQESTRDIAERYGYVKAGLARQGTLLPENDIWIAACALECGARLATYDAHFGHVAGLVTVAP